MDEKPFFPDDELTAEDLAIIQAFDALDDLAFIGDLDEQDITQSNSAPLMLDNNALNMENPEDMLILFASEADEDIATMKRAMQQVQHDKQASSPGLISLGRSAHKLKGTAGAMGCEALSTIALHIEEEIQLLKSEKITFLNGLMVLDHAIDALGLTLHSVVNDGHESTQPLEEMLQEMNEVNAEITRAPSTTDETSTAAQEIASREMPEISVPTIATQVDTHSLYALMSHAEQLVELHNPLQNAQLLVTQSLMELQAAYARLRRLEGLFTKVAFPASITEQGHTSENQSSPSLVARILHEALQRTGRPAQSRSRPPSTVSNSVGRTHEQFLWDEMEMDSFTENRILLQSFSEAVADVATATAQLRSAFAQLNTLLEQQIRQSSLVHSDTLRLRSIPFSVLLARVQRAVQKIEQDHHQPIQFETAGETTEIDQDMLETLSKPILQLLHTSVPEGLLSIPQPTSEGAPANTMLYRIWLQARSIGNEIVIELGFSMPIQGGAVDDLRGPIQQLQGTIAARRNTTGGVSYQLRLPRAQGVFQGLLVQSGRQNMVLSLAHIHSIDYKHQQPYAHIYDLTSLLGFPVNSAIPNLLTPIILLANTTQRIGVQVDEIIGEIEVIMKPLAAHLQRPGVIGSAVDGSGNILLILDPLALIQHGIAQRRTQTLPLDTPLPAQTQAQPAHTSTPTTVLVADDSVSIRQSLRNTFERAGYNVIEARDGMEALEHMTSGQPPAVLLLDIEMPNLNGFDLLNILQQPGLHQCKAILLTSRSSEKYRERAMSLGAYAFLGKPCPPEVLLNTVRQALNDTPASM